MYRGCDTLKLRLHPWKIDAWKTIWLPFWGNLGQFSGAIFCEGIHFSLPCLVKSWQQELLEAFKNATFNSAAGGGANPEGKKTPGPSWTPKNLNHEWRECTIERVCRHNHGKFTKVWLCFGHDSWHLFLWFESFLRFGLFFCFKLSLLLKHGCSKMQQSSLTRKKKRVEFPIYPHGLPIGFPQPRMSKHPALGVVRLDYDYPPAPGDSDHPGETETSQSHASWENRHVRH